MLVRDQDRQPVLPSSGDDHGQVCDVADVVIGWQRGSPGRAPSRTASMVAGSSEVSPPRWMLWRASAYASRVRTRDWPASGGTHGPRRKVSISANCAGQRPGRHRAAGSPRESSKHSEPGAVTCGSAVCCASLFSETRRHAF
jgi:hypothetical protein